MKMLRRHQLWRLTPAGWTDVLSYDRPAVERECLEHWAATDLPVVVATQVAWTFDTMITLGLPAPQRWQRRRISMRVWPWALADVVESPEAEEVTNLLPPKVQEAWDRLVDAVQGDGCRLQIYGSYGWQKVTGLDYLHPASDLDVLAHVGRPEQADRVARLLFESKLEEVPLDGELMFSTGDAFAWREWAIWRRGGAPSIVVKRLEGPSLISTLAAVRTTR